MAKNVLDDVPPADAMERTSRRGSAGRMSPSARRRVRRTAAQRMRSAARWRTLVAATTSIMRPLQEDAIDSIPAEIGKQAAQARLRAFEVQIVPKARLGAGSLDTRLVGVELPRMKIEHRRLAGRPR